MPGFTAAIIAEITEMLKYIPSSELAIQWDMAIENRLIEVPLNLGNLDGAKAAAERAAKPAQDICLGIPEEVAIGYHSCYGTLDGWPSRTPPDATGTQHLLNTVIEASGRTVEFLVRTNTW